VSERENELLGQARRGDRRAYDDLVAPHLGSLRGLLRRMVGDPQDAADLLQDTLLRAHSRLETFRGDSKLSTWLCSIAVRLALNHLSSRRLEEGTQIRLRDHIHDRQVGELRQRFATDAYDAREHIAFCFTCVSRSLPGEEQAALILRDVLELSNDEAARTLDVSTPVLRHHLASARAAMQSRFEGLCRLVSKTGVCHQCEGLRESFRPERRGPPPHAGAGRRRSRASVAQASRRGPRGRRRPRPVTVIPRFSVARPGHAPVPGTLSRGRRKGRERAGRCPPPGGALVPLTQR